MDRTRAAQGFVAAILLASGSTVYAGVHVGIGIDLPIVTPPPVYYGPPPAYYRPPPPVYYGPGVVYGGGRWDYGGEHRGRDWAHDRWHRDHGPDRRGHDEHGHR